MRRPTLLELRTALVIASIGASAAVSAVSLTRIAGEHLGFPSALAWTFTAAADIGAIAGAVTWVASIPGSRERRTGVVTNVACSAISALFVGLDHAANGGWGFAAFVVGAFLPLLSTWLVHDLVQSLAPAPAPVSKARHQQAEKSKPETKSEPRAKPVAPAPSAPDTDPPAVIYAREHWPCTAEQIEQGARVSRATAYRALNRVRGEKSHDHVAA